MEKKYTSIGGQALIEGVMMRGKASIAMSVRKPDGDIETKMDKVSHFFSHPFFKWPVLRGMVALINAMVIGIRALTYSAEFYPEDDVEPSKFDEWVKKVFKDRADDVLIGVSMVFALVLALLLFAVLPAWLTGLLRNAVGQTLWLSLIEGGMKVVFFVTYIVLISRMKDIQRVFEYHGAEHKTIHCFEAGEVLTPENAMKYSRIHPRCGTSFLLFVMAISILMFSFVTWTSIVTRILWKLLLMPLVAGLAFEMIRLAGKSDHPLVKAISGPGLMMQRLTTREPDLDQLAVAIAAMEAVIEEEGGTQCAF